MYTMIRSIQSRLQLAEQGLILSISLIIAELFYKFHSFILECSAFLATWFFLDVLGHALRSVVTKNRSHTHVAQVSPEDSAD